MWLLLILLLSLMLKFVLNDIVDALEEILKLSCPFCDSVTLLAFVEFAVSHRLKFTLFKRQDSKVARVNRIYNIT